MNNIKSEFDSIVESRKQYLKDLDTFSSNLRELIKKNYQMKLMAEKMKMSKKTLENKFRKPSTFKDDEIHEIIEILVLIDEV